MSNLLMLLLIVALWIFVHAWLFTETRHFHLSQAGLSGSIQEEITVKRMQGMV